ncbi:hypothetical protein LTR96_011363 [Exophiala xenobiotica]|nr:hypothetical protein LTR96_011363 [Exophiala xenobiotica]KAK5332881.1 hypothetical protein LTR98_011003 [Exophiala xenobiotica]
MPIAAKSYGGTAATATRLKSAWSVNSSMLLSAGLMEGWTDEEFAEAKIADCYIQAKSTQNIRIERMWRGQRDTTIGPWLRYFRRLELAGHFHDHLVCDKTVICFIFMPIIRQQLAAFVDTHNANPIRKQKQRILHVSGVPDQLYKDDALRVGIPAMSLLIDWWKQQVANYDIDAYLTTETEE